MHKKRVVLFTVLILIFLPFTMLIPTAMADNTFYQEMTIANHQTGYEMFVNVSYDSDMQNDFDDIRFLDDDQLTELPYWREMRVNGSYAWYWVKIPDGATMYMYYGDPALSYTGNGSEVFAYFDDWTTNNTADWTFNDYDNTNKVAQYYINNPLKNTFENERLRYGHYDTVVDVDNWGSYTGVGTAHPIMLNGGSSNSDRDYIINYADTDFGADATIFHF